MKVNRDIVSQIQTDYEHSKMTRSEICEKYGISNATLTNYARAFGFEPRRNRIAYVPYVKREAVCDRCKRTVSVPGARFCPYCGSDIRTEAMKVQDSLSSLLTITNLIPDSTRDTYVKTIRDAIRLLGDSTEDEDET